MFDTFWPLRWNWFFGFNITETRSKRMRRQIWELIKVSRAASGAMIEFGISVKKTAEAFAEFDQLYPRMQNTHTEQIICPECGRVQTATIEHTVPWWTYVHECECGYWIMESEWEMVNDGRAR